MISPLMEKDFNEFSQRIAEAIESVLKIDVTIMNNKMIRIAGTGKYKNEVNNTVGKNTAFDFCITTGNICVVEDAKSSSLCINCDRTGICEEKADICVPIRYKGDSIGVIGAIAFSVSQKKKIIDNKEIYINFAQKMASFIGAKYAELMVSQENQKLSLRMDCIMNAMKQAVIYYDTKGDVIYKNLQLERLLKKVGVQETNKFPKILWHYIKRMELKNTENIENIEIVLNENNKDYTFLADITVIREADQREEYLVTLKDYGKVQMGIIRQTEGKSLSVDFDSILSISSCMQEIKKMAKTVALTDSNILIDGESGTGKEIFARAIHNYSNRSEKPFIPLNCGAIPDMLLESELFGYEKGAFTGADKKKLGKFEIADGGTLFLDEIGDLPLRLQVKLLRVLQEHEVCRLGSNDIRKINVRILSATNTNLLEKIMLNQFREDLYYRLNIIPIHLPSLRERKEDIDYLTEHYINFYNSLFGKSIRGLAKEAQFMFRNYPWPGNIRELQNILEYAVCLESGDLISEELIKKRMTLNPSIHFQKQNSGDDIMEPLEEYDRQRILKLIEQYCHLKHRKMVDTVCHEMQISRSTYYRKIKKYEIRG